MSVYDLATDVGLVKGSDDYEAFVACVQNILELGTGYSPAAMHDIVEKCNTSELEIAKRVVRECRREKTSAFRETRLKWWETYVTRRERISRDIYLDRTPSRPKRAARTRRPKRQQKRSMSPVYERKRQQKRPMSPMFERERQQKRPMSPMFERKRQQKRPMSPMFERERQQKRSMSPMFERENNSVPQWGKRPAPYERRPPSPKYRRRSNKRRRY